MSKRNNGEKNGIKLIKTKYDHSLTTRQQEYKFYIRQYICTKERQKKHASEE